MVHIDAWSEPDGPALEVDGRLYRARYPEDAWAAFPFQGRLLRELAFVATAAVPVLARERSPVSSLPAPLGLDRYLRWIDLEVPGLMCRRRTDSSLLARRRFRRVGWRFEGSRALPADGPSPLPHANRALLANSLGADSLASLLIAREVGLETTSAHYRELSVPQGGRASDSMFAAFEAASGLPTSIVESDLHEPSLFERYGRRPTELGGVLMLPRLCLLMLPFALRAKARTLLVGCELDLTYEDHALPFGRVYERWLQTAWGVGELDAWVGELTDGAVRVATLLGSLHDIAKLRLLHGADPRLGRLSRSCWWDESDRAWCGWCWDCAQKYLHLVAQGVDPASCGFDCSMFDREVARSRFATFAGGRAPADAVARDQELLAFLEAYRRGASGWAVERFARRALRKAEAREAELRERYLEPEDRGAAAHLYAEALAATRRLVRRLPKDLLRGPGGA